MGLSCGAKMAKVFLFIFNVIFFILGAVILGIGIWIVVDKDKLVELASQALGDNADVVTNQLNTRSTVEVGAYVLIGVGAFNFLVGFCGCCGACTENKCLLGIYAALIGLIMLLEIVGAILGGVFQKEVTSKLKEGLAINLNKTYIGMPFSKKQDNPASSAWDFIMVTTKCCGLNGVEDFTKNAASKAAKWNANGRKADSGTLKIPYACCKYKDTEWAAKASWDKYKTERVDTNCGIQLVSYNKIGCYDAVKDKVTKYAVAIIATAAIIVVIELFGIILACCLIRAIDEDM